MDSFESFLQEIQPEMLQLLIKCSKSKFNTHNPDSAFEYERNGITLNESSIDEYLAEIEEYTNKILVVMGKANNQSVKEVMSKVMMIDELPSKTSKKKVNVLFHLYRTINSLMSRKTWQMSYCMRATFDSQPSEKLRSIKRVSH